MENYIYYGIGLKDDTLYLSSKESSKTPHLFIKSDDNEYPWVGMHLNGISVAGTVNTITDTNLLFACCDCFEIDLRGLDASNITNMSYMFYNCKNLRSINLSEFDTSNVTDMSNMFNNCSNLEHLDISNFDVSKVKNMSYMFRNCTKLHSLNTGLFKTSPEVYKSGMFHGCNNEKI